MNLATSERLPESTIAQAKRVDVVELARRHSELRKVGQEWAGPCPKCGGTDRFHCATEWFFCRICHEKRGDSIEFVRWLQPGLTFTDAVAQLVDGTLPIAAPTKPYPNRAQTVPKNTAEWRTKATKTLQTSQERLFSPDGVVAQDYLQSRGLDPQTWMQFGFGYRADVAIPGTEGKERAPAIAIPWFAGGRLIGIRYRFLETQGKHKLAAEFGSTFSGRLFGAQALPEYVRFDGDGRFEKMADLVIVEGEINAVSVWQIANQTNLCVLSLGSESQGLSPAMVTVAQRFRNVLFWADRSEVAHKLQDALPGAHSVSSPDGKDANDLLKAGLLGALLGMVRLRSSRNMHDRQGAFWDLFDGSRGCFDDEGTRQLVLRERQNA